jgi:hypothetical protein
MKDKLTICIFTHIINVNTKDPYLHNEMIPKMIKSASTKLNLKETDYKIYCDSDMFANYPKLTEKYLKNIEQSLLPLNNLSIEIVRNTRSGLRGNWELAMETLKTPYMMFLEHDWEFVEDVNISNVLSAFENYPEISYIRFPKRPIKKDSVWNDPIKHFDWILKPENNMDNLKIPLSNITCFSGNPHIMRVSAAKEKYIPLLELNSPYKNNKQAYHLEKEIRPIILETYKKYGTLTAQEYWGTYIYGKYPQKAIVKHLGDWCRRK